MKRFIIVIVFIFIGSIIAFLFMNRDNSLHDIVKKDKIRIGYAFEAPYAFLNENGEVTGLEPEVAKLVTKNLGIKNIEWKLYEFGSLILALELNEIDVIATGMYITKERSKRVSFSEPTFKAVQSLLVTKGNPNNIDSYKDALKIEGFKIAVLEGAIEKSLLSEIGFNKTNIIAVPDANSGKVAVETGLVDGFALSLPSLKWMEKNEKLDKSQLVNPFLQPDLNKNKYLGYGAFEFRKNDIQLQKAWNIELKKIIGSNKHLSLIKIFGNSAILLPGTISTDEIITKD